MGSPAPQVGSPAPQGGEPGSPSGSTPGSRGARLPFGLPMRKLGAGHVAGLAVPDLFTPATLAAFKSTLSPTCGRAERGEQIRHSPYGPENPAPFNLQWGCTPGESGCTPGEPDSPTRGAGQNFFVSSALLVTFVLAVLHVRRVAARHAVARRMCACSSSHAR